MPYLSELSCPLLLSFAALEAQQSSGKNSPATNSSSGAPIQSSDVAPVEPTVADTTVVQSVATVSNVLPEQAPPIVPLPAWAAAQVDILQRSAALTASRISKL